MIIVEDIIKFYNEVDVLKGVSLRVEPSEMISIMGKSGAGKSTLLHIMGTLDKADGGKVILDGVDVTKMSEKELSRIRNEKIGFVFQFHHLLHEFTALENVCIPALIAKENKVSKENRAKELLDYLGMSHRLEHKPSQLSGGEAQRVAIARALMNQPKIILADEPTGNLDKHNSDELHQLFLKMRQDFQQTFVIVTHNQELANLCDRLVQMQDGVVLE